MRPAIVTAAIAAAALTACAPLAPPAQTTTAALRPVMAWPALLTRPRPAPTRTIAYCPDPHPVADPWLPAATRKGPHPTVLMVHGGCWTTAIADRSIMNWIADDLARRGYAVWNIDYRGVDRPGGGYPGTFRDVAAAADALRGQAAANNLDLRRLVAVGHSAGGHLALWLAGRSKLPAGSPLRTAATPLPIHHVVSLGGLQDLEQDRAEINGCGSDVIDQLVGPPTTRTRDVYADTSLPRLAPIGVAHTMVNGDRDRIIPTHFAATYAARMRGHGDRVTVRIVPNQGHVELIAPETPAWATAVKAIAKATR
ncbi:alpha/beta hydrolase [Sphingomonas sp.]|uniref:alpha/beta hydrolase n=1 Tax=Sphingomonas sp. TaxID=28214 RepID=UPI00286B6252|nr:alpha/beta hydrolase [Sphingomonas sp.]